MLQDGLNTRTVAYWLVMELTERRRRREGRGVFFVVVLVVVLVVVVGGGGGGVWVCVRACVLVGILS